MDRRRDVENAVTRKLDQLRPGEIVEVVCVACGNRRTALSARGVEVVTGCSFTTVATWTKKGLNSAKILSARVIWLDDLIDYLVDNQDRLRAPILREIRRTRHERRRIA